MSDRSTPEQLGKFQIRGVLGRGAMGTVYDGWDPLIGRRVAIKTVRLQYDEDDEEARESVARFKREAQAAGRLSHENIVGVFDYGETNDVAYIVMEFVEGTSLKALVDPGLPVPPARAAELMQQVLSGLDFSHRRGVVHRDIKPANVMLTSEGKVKLADFGIAKITSSNMTSVGVIMGTPAYMPPEQFLGEPADSRSDIYAAGAMLFHMLTGKRPYEGNPTSIMQRVLNAPQPPSVSERVTGLSNVWDQVINRAMARRAEDRFQTAAEFADAITQALHTPESSFHASAAVGFDAEATIIQSSRHAAAAPAVGKPVTTAPKHARKPSPVPLIAAGVVAVVAIGGGAAWFFTRSSTPIAPAPAPAQTAVPVPAPVSAPAPAPAPAPVNLQATLGARINDLECSSLTVGSAGELSGIADNVAMQQAMQAAGAGVSQSVQIFPATYCPAVDVLRPVIRTVKLDFTVPETAGNVAVSSNVMLHPTIHALPFNSWVLVDYLSSDGTVFHVLPSKADKSAGFLADPAVLLPSGSDLTLGQGTHAALQPGTPYGTDMIIAIASSKQLFNAPRPQGESIATYAAALQSAIDQAQANGAQVAAGVVVLTTVQAAK